MSDQEYGKDHASDLLYQNQAKMPKAFGLVNGRFGGSYPGKVPLVTIKPVFCQIINGHLCNPEDLPQTIQAIVLENDSASVKVVKNGIEITDQVPVICANCPVSRSSLK